MLSTTEKKACFVISPIGEADSEVRKRADQILRHVIRPAVQECGYDAVRADEIDKPGIITSQVIQHIVSDPLVVADLTGRNPNVFYELAVRHAIRRPLVQLIQKGEPIPFDVAATRTIYVDHHDLDSVASARAEIVSQIRALEKDPASLETPISVSLDLQMLRQSENPEERSLADLVAAVTDLRVELTKMEGRIGSTIESPLKRVSDILLFLERSDMRPGQLRGRGKMSEGMQMEVMHLLSRYTHGVAEDAALLVAASPFREEHPWLYDIAAEVALCSSNGTARSRCAELVRLLSDLLEGPLSQILLAASQERRDFRDSFYLLRDAVKRVRERVGLYVSETELEQRRQEDRRRHDPVISGEPSSGRRERAKPKDPPG